MAPGAESRKVANSLVALSSTAILVVYAAGFLKTRAASAMLDEASNGRRPSIPAPATAGDTPTTVTRDVASALPAATDPISPLTPGVAPVAGEPRAAAMPTAGTLVAALPGAATSAATSAASPEPSSTAAPATPAIAPAEIATAPVAPQAPEPVATTVEPALQATLQTKLATTQTAHAAPIEEKKVATLLMPKEQYKDGSYLGWGRSRHGDIQASVTITNGRITDASIAQCRTRYSCNVVDHLPAEVVERQSPDVDYVTGATQSANAFYFGVVEALAKAK